MKEHCRGQWRYDSVNGIASSIEGEWTAQECPIALAVGCRSVDNSL